VRTQYGSDHNVSMAKNVISLSYRGLMRRWIGVRDSMVSETNTNFSAIGSIIGVESDQESHGDFPTQREIHSLLQTCPWTSRFSPDQGREYEGVSKLSAERVGSSCHVSVPSREAPVSSLCPGSRPRAEDLFG
jgi:hypothetical protein